jgi:hypothetical protein
MIYKIIFSILFSGIYDNNNGNNLTFAFSIIEKY